MEYGQFERMTYMCSKLCSNELSVKLGKCTINSDQFHSLSHLLSSLELGLTFSSLPSVFCVSDVSSILFLYAASWGISSNLICQFMNTPFILFSLLFNLVIKIVIFKNMSLFIKFKFDTLLSLPSHFYSLCYLFVFKFYLTII